jgi:glutamate 5-kinase
MDKKPIIVFDADEQPLLTPGKLELCLDTLDVVAKVLSYLRNQEMQVLLVSAGAIVAGVRKLGLAAYPKQLAEKQAIAAIGQVELIKRYQRAFDEYNHTVGQVLLARNITEIAKHRINAKNVFAELYSLGIIPVINENDTVSTDDILEETNFPLTVTVANIVGADLIIRLDTSGQYDAILPGGGACKKIATYEELFDYISKMEPKQEAVMFTV